MSATTPLRLVRASDTDAPRRRPVLVLASASGFGAADVPAYARADAWRRMGPLVRDTLVMSVLAHGVGGSRRGGDRRRRRAPSDGR